jgi:shikimate dehydrogenase
MVSMREKGLVGLNVTLPHKEKVARLVAIDDPLTRRLGSVNTVYFEDGRMCGMSTDGVGFMNHLVASVPDWQAAGCSVVVLGAGGAARAVIAALSAASVARLSVANRTRARAETLAADLGPGIEVVEWTNLTGALREADLLVNTTSLGMAGHPPLDLDLDELQTSAVVADIVYVPLETALLAKARRRGHRTVDGLGMLLHQAVPGFARWFGVTPEVTAELRALLAADITGA